MQNDNEKELFDVSLYQLAKGKFREGEKLDYFETFHIPYYQRGYRWTGDNITTLLDDLLDFLNSNDSEISDYYMQPLAIKFDNDKRIVVDGQQRLTTFYLIYLYLNNNAVEDDSPEWNSIEDKWYKIDYDNDISKSLLLKKIKLLTIIDKNSPNYEKDNKKRIEEISAINDINYFYIRNAYSYIHNWFKQNSGNEDIFTKLFEDNLDKKIKFLIYPINQQDEHEVFQNINSGKIPLSNADLIKALLLVKSSGLIRREQIAAVYETMERQFQDNRFWYMFNSEDVKKEKGQTRIDYLFNLVEDVSDKEYQNDSRTAFYKISKSENLESKWIEVEKAFQILLEFYKNPEYYHYIGFLVFADINKRNDLIKTLIAEYTETTKSNFLQESLKNRIRKLFEGKTLADYVYYSTSDGKKKMSNKEFQKLFVLHNIETILIRYRELKKINIRDTNKQNLQLNMFEYFPFDLFYNNNSWDIEHISSQTTNDLESKEDKKEWIQSALGEYSNEELKIENTTYSVGSDEFKGMLDNEDKYESIMDSLKTALNLNDEGLENDEELKNYLGNLVLLDSHTNRSFHNSIFPQKRRIVLKASGILSNEADDKTKNTYIPPCTKDVYTKAYSTSKSLGFLNWTKEDARDYVNDIANKLSLSKNEANAQKESNNDVKFHFIERGDLLNDQL